MKNKIFFIVILGLMSVSFFVGKVNAQTCNCTSYQSGPTECVLRCSPKQVTDSEGNPVPGEFYCANDGTGVCDPATSSCSFWDPFNEPYGCWTDQIIWDKACYLDTDASDGCDQRYNLDTGYRGCCEGTTGGGTTGCVVGSTSCKTNCTENEKGGGSCPGGCPAGQYCCEVLSCPADGGGVSCIPSSGSDPTPANCSQTGFYGRTYATLRSTTLPVAKGYSCNPFATPIGGEVCNYWDNQWTGYLNLDQAGDYEFWISYQPALKFQIDVNQNGVFDQVCGSITSGDVGDNFLFISGSCATKYRYTYLDSWLVTSGATGNDCWDDFETRTACEEGRHCQNADYRTTAVNTYPTIVTPLTSSLVGPSECPISAVNSRFPEETVWGEKGTGHSYFTRTLNSGSTLIDMRYKAHYGDQNNNQVLAFKYRKVGSPTWIDLANPTTYGGVCPISPCVMEPPIPLVSWWQVKDSDLITNGDITSDVPTGNVLSDDGAGGYPGVTVFGSTLDYGGGTLSSTDWNANTTYSSLKVYNYSTFARQFPEEVVAGASVITDPVIDQTVLTSGGYLDSRGYYWYIYSGINDPVISGDINLADRKVILLIPGKDLSIEGNIALTDGVGFLALFVGIDTDSNGGDITVSGGVASLEGIYLTDGIFSTGTLGVGTDSQLYVRGAVAALGGIAMQRDLADNTGPSELWEYGADQIMLLMANPSIAIRKMSWKEVAP